MVKKTEGPKGIMANIRRSKKMRVNIIEVQGLELEVSRISKNYKEKPKCLKHDSEQPQLPEPPNHVSQKVKS